MRVMRALSERFFLKTFNKSRKSSSFSSYSFSSVSCAAFSLIALASDGSRTLNEGETPAM